MKPKIFEKRVNFLIPEEYLNLLNEEATQTHTTVSNIIRDMIRERYKDKIKPY